MQIRKAGHRGGSILVEWSDHEGVPRRTLVPPVHVGPDWVEDSVLKRCPEDPDTVMLENRLGMAVTDRRLLLAFLKATRRRGIWTANDGVARPNEVRAAYDEAMGSPLTAIMNSYRELAG